MSRLHCDSLALFLMSDTGVIHVFLSPHKQKTHLNVSKSVIFYQFSSFPDKYHKELQTKRWNISLKAEF